MNFDRNKYEFILGTHSGKKMIWVKFEYDLKLKNSLKSNTKAHWSASEKCWYLLDNIQNREICGLEVLTSGKEAILKISAINRIQMEKYQQFIILKGYSPNTYRTYTLEFAQLLYVLKDFPVEQLSTDQLQSYFYYCTETLRLSENIIHSRMNAVKLYFEKVLHREKMFFDIPRPKKPLLLPKHLSVDEVKKLFNVVDNLKHRVLLKLVYGMGLRVSEAVRLKISDVDSDSMKVCVHRGKEKKDRYVNLPSVILGELREYYKAYRLKEYIFEG